MFIVSDLLVELLNVDNAFSTGSRGDVQRTRGTQEATF